MNYMALPYLLKKILQTRMLFLFFFAGACAPAEITPPPDGYLEPVRITPGPRQGDYNYAYRVLSYNPVNYYNVKHGQKLQVTWNVKNDGAEA